MKYTLVLTLLVMVGCAAKKPVAHLVIPPECRKELEFKPCSAEPNNPDWCSGKYRMRFVCTKVVK
jgi:hypothetical protein